MPLYVVRWPHLRASLIKARDPADLACIVDEVGEFAECTWWEYRGPLWIDFEPPVKFVAKFRDDNLPMQHDEFALHGVAEYAAACESDETGPLRYNEGPADTGAEMRRQIMLKAFPTLGEFWARWDGASELHPSELEQALRADLHRLMQLDWKDAAEKRGRGE